jgi:hypothetical protein
VRLALGADDLGGVIVVPPLDALHGLEWNLHHTRSPVALIRRYEWEP